MKRSSFLLALLLPLALPTRPAHAWLAQGHSIIAEGAVKALPAEMPLWFRAGVGQISHGAQDPDIQKNRALPMMTEREYPQHFFDWELIGMAPLPPTRREFYAECAKRGVSPFDVGELPYALAEWTQRLTIAFAEARKYPDDVYIRNKALVYAGILSHYAGDATMPLHVTLDHDGRVKPDGSSPKTGIHSKVDSLIEKSGDTPERLARGQIIEPLPALWPGIETQMRETYSHVDQTYALEAQLPGETDSKLSPAVEAFALERGRMAARFTARLFLTAWRDSEKINLPSWLKR